MVGLNATARVEPQAGMVEAFPPTGDPAYPNLDTAILDGDGVL
jgi:streptogramin lyase